VRILTLFAAAGFMAWPLYSADPDPHEIVEKSIANYEKDWTAALSFTYTEQDVSKGASGRAKSMEVFQVSPLDGTPYSRMIAKNGNTLNGDEAARENEKYDKALESRGRETPEQHARRVRKYQEERGFLREISDAFDIKLLGHETLNGRANYVIQLTPKAGYIPKSKNARMFSDIQGKLWVDEQDLRWTKAVADVVNTISIGWVLARIGPGAHITMTQVKVDDGHWMPKEIDVSGAARIMLVKNRTLDERVSYSGYRRVSPGQGTPAAKNR
jgi:hypothetical protein